MIPTSQGPSSITPAKSKTTYVDLDQLLTLESRISNIKKHSECLLYYLGWTQQRIQPWQIESQPNSFSLEQARAVVLHLPPTLRNL